MENLSSDPRWDDPPDDPVGQIAAFAKDLAYGVVVNDWPMVLVNQRSRVNIAENEKYQDYAERKWANYPTPTFDVLIGFGYVQVVQEEYEVLEPPPLGAGSGHLPGYRRRLDPSLILTNRAFELLKQPTSTSIFISYRRRESSALALLLLARFKLIGLAPFLDMNIEPGNDWHAQLENEVKTRDHFVCLVGPRTLKSKYVRQEIQWAVEAGKRVIPIWHNRFDDANLISVQAQYPELAVFFERQAIRVEQETPLAYDNAVTQLLNRFGIMT
jgi:hypothetical protein